MSQFSWNQPDLNLYKTRPDLYNMVVKKIPTKVGGIIEFERYYDIILLSFDLTRLNQILGSMRPVNNSECIKISDNLLVLIESGSFHCFSICFSNTNNKIVKGRH